MAKIIGVSKFERLFREAAGLDVDKNDLARLNDFVRQKVYELLLAAQATAKDNQRDVIQLHDLPLTLGFKESMRAFDGLDTALELQPVRTSDYRELITAAAREAAATEQGAPIAKAVIEALKERKLLVPMPELLIRLV